MKFESSRFQTHNSFQHLQLGLLPITGCLVTANKQKVLGHFYSQVTQLIFGKKPQWERTILKIYMWRSPNCLCIKITLENKQGCSGFFFNMSHQILWSQSLMSELWNIGIFWLGFFFSLPIRIILEISLSC